MTNKFMSHSSGTFIGYDKDGSPVAVATYGQRAGTRTSAEQFASSGGLDARHFEQGDPKLVPELDRFHRQILNEVPR